MDPGELDALLAEAFDAPPGARRVVVRQATDLDGSGRYRADAGHDLAPSLVVEHLRDAPGGTVVDRWNWWMGALDVAYGGYGEFAVRRYREE